MHNDELIKQILTNQIAIISALLAMTHDVKAREILKVTLEENIPIVHEMMLELDNMSVN